MPTAHRPIPSHALRELIRAELPDLVAVRHDLHAHPELGYDEHRTSAVVQRELARAGVEFRADLAGGTGVLAHLGGDGVETIGLRADMDALPIPEETGVAYCSTRPGVMHACGHDGHTTILLGAARVLSKIARQSGLPRPVSFVFQPAEEGGAGARRMIEDGALDGSVLGAPVHEMYGLHGWPRAPLGTAGTRIGPLLAATDNFEVSVRGRGGHAAFPHMTCDPIPAACAIVGALQTIASRNVDPVDSVVVSVTKFHGGSAMNVIMDEVRFAGTVRTLRAETRTFVQERLCEIAQTVAEAYGCSADVDHEVGYPVTLNHAQAVGVFNAVAPDVLGSERVFDVPAPFMGGEDFSYYCHEVPSCFFILGLLPPGRKTRPDLHQPTFDFNDDAIPVGVELFCRLALR